MPLQDAINRLISTLEDHAETFEREQPITPVVYELIGHLKLLGEVQSAVKQNDIIKILLFIESIRYLPGFLWGAHESFQRELQRHGCWTTGMTVTLQKEAPVLQELTKTTRDILKTCHAELSHALRYAHNENNEILTQAIASWRALLLTEGDHGSDDYESYIRDIKIEVPELPTELPKTRAGVEKRIEAFLNHAVGMDLRFVESREALKQFLGHQGGQEMDRIFLYEFNDVFHFRDAQLQEGEMLLFDQKQTRFRQSWVIEEGRVLCYLSIDTHLLFVPPAQYAVFFAKNNTIQLLGADFYESLKSRESLPSIMKAKAVVEWVPNREGFSLKVTQFEMDIVSAKNVVLVYGRPETLEKKELEIQGPSL